MSIVRRDFAEWGRAAVHDRRRLYRLAVGIDLGTTSSLVATLRNAVPECLPDADGRSMLPSAVRYGEDGAIDVGAAALAHRGDDALNTITSVKRFMGRSVADLRSDAAARYQFSTPTGDGTTEQFFTIKIAKGRVASQRLWSPDSLVPATSTEPPLEEVTFVYHTIEWTYTNGGVTHQDTWDANA